MISATQAATASGNSDVLSALRAASAKTGLDFDYLLNTAMRESSLNSQAKSKGSSASGLFQFIDQTWLGLVKRFGERYGLGSYAGAIQQNRNGHFSVASADTKAAILALRQNPELSAVMAGESAKQTKQSLECALGRQVCGGELYAAHFLGPSGARHLIQLKESDPSAQADVAFPQAAKGNKAAFYHGDGTPKTVGELYSSLVNPSPSQTPPAFSPAAPQTQMIASNVDSSAAQNVFASSVDSSPGQPTIASDHDSESNSRTAYRSLATADRAGRDAAPLLMRGLPQANVLLTPGMMEMLSSLAPVATLRRET
jgi:hypothetical protein